jgi:hypothetical protein
MRRPIQAGLMALLVTLAGSTVATGQQPAAPAEPPEVTPAPAGQGVFSLNVTVVIARYRGDTRVSSLPYSLTVTTGGPTSQLRMGAEVPVRVSSGSITYRPVATNIDARATTLRDEGRFQLGVTVNDNSVYEDDSPSGGAATASGQPVFRTFMASNTIVLRDGQSTTFTAATDRVSGEVIRIEVTINVQP